MFTSPPAPETGLGVPRSLELGTEYAEFQRICSFSPLCVNQSLVFHPLSPIFSFVFCSVTSYLPTSPPRTKMFLWFCYICKCSLALFCFKSCKECFFSFIHNSRLCSCLDTDVCHLSLKEEKGEKSRGDLAHLPHCPPLLPLMILLQRCSLPHLHSNSGCSCYLDPC